MPTLPTPSPVTAPLPGGTPEAEVDVLPLRCGTMPAPPALLRRPGGPLWPLGVVPQLVRRGGWPEIPIPAFLLRHPQAGAIVVDSGLHASVREDPSHTLGRFGARFYETRSAPGEDLAAQLARHDVRVEDVALVVMTHLHYDHTSGLEHLPDGTPVLTARAEWDAFAAGGFRDGYLHHHARPGLAWQTLDVHGAGEPHGAFAHTADLLGDGSVRLCATPGHTHGHLSLLVRGAGGRRVLLTGDASYSARGLAESWTPLLMADARAFRTSADALRADLEAHPGTLAAHGHDPEVWPPFADVA